MSLNGSLSGSQNPETENAAQIASLQNQLSQAVAYMQSLDFGSNQILTPGAISQGVSTASTSSSNSGGLINFTSQTVVFSSTPMNQTTWITVPVPSGISGAKALFVQVQGSAENVTPQAQLQTRSNAFDSNVLILSVGVDPTPGNVSDFSFNGQWWIHIDSAAQSFQYQIVGPNASSSFSNLTMTIIGYQ